MTQEIENIIKELNARIDLLSSTDEKLELSKVSSVLSITNKYGKIDSTLFSDEDLNKLYELLNIEENSSLRTDKELLNDYLNKYINDNKELKGNLDDIRSNEIELYKKYINILTSSKFDELFNDFDELDELFNDLGIQPADKWQILKHIDYANFNTKEYGLFAININSKLIQFNNIYLTNKPLVEEIDNKLTNMNIDLGMIPNLVKRFSKNGNDEEVHNIIVTLILNELYKRLIDYINKEEMDKVHEVELTIKEALKYANNFEESIVSPTEEIVLSYDKLLSEELNKGNDIKSYMSISIEDLEKTYESHDKAVNLKLLPIVNSMKETLSSMKETDETSEEYTDYLKLLMNLNEAYNEIKES